MTKGTEHGTYGYDHDDLYRLTDVTDPLSDDEAYTYDAVGNRASASNTTGDIEHNQNNELELYGDLSFDYDANSNLTAKTSASEDWVYTYNVQNRLVRVEEDDLLVAEYGYDPFGRRLWKEVDGERTYFLYSDEGLVAEYDEEGNELRSYGYRPSSTWGTDPLWLREDGEYYWFQNDHLGTPQKLVDSSGEVVWSATYTAFGEAIIDVETIENNLRFPGQYYDAETGLHYNWNRLYDPDTGKYTRVDPIGFGGGSLNLYAYVDGNPVSWIDPYGLTTLCELLLQCRLQCHNMKFNEFYEEAETCYNELAPEAVLTGVVGALETLEVTGVSPQADSDLKALLPNGIQDVNTIEQTPGVDLVPVATRSGDNAWQAKLPEELWELKIYHEKDGQYRTSVGYRSPRSMFDILKYDTANWLHAGDFILYLLKEHFGSPSYPNPYNAEKYGGFCVDDPYMLEKLRECRQHCQ